MDSKARGFGYAAQCSQAPDVTPARQRNTAASIGVEVSEHTAVDTASVLSPRHRHGAVVLRSCVLPTNFL